MRNMLATLCLLALPCGAGCGPQPIAQQCVKLDDELWAHAGRPMWCDGIEIAHEDPSVTYEGEPPPLSVGVCVPLQADGTCKVCPYDEVHADVEAALPARIEATDKGETCVPEHWEIGCANRREYGEPYTPMCCYAVAVWGPGCEYP